MADLLSYPASLGKDVAQGQHYMLIDSYESINAVEREGNGKQKSSIALYIPPNSLSSTLGQSYEGLKGGATMGAGAQALGITGGRGSSEQLSSFVKQAATGLLSKPQKIADLQTATAGLARNNHLALVYRGPSEFRTHTFNFSFWPKSKTEADTVKLIINDFQAGSTPRMAGIGKDVTKLMSPYFKSPRQWEIKFCKGGTSGASDAAVINGGINDYLFKIQTSVITTMTVNHDPDSVVGFHSDGAPVHTTLAITFQEISYFLSSDLLSPAEQAAAAQQSEAVSNMIVQKPSAATGKPGLGTKPL